jgi:hypothetical protein
MKFTISARGKSANTPVLRFLATNFGNIAVRQIDSVFGFVERCSLYGGRVFKEPELAGRDIGIMNELGIGLRLPLSNHYVDRAEYESFRPLLRKYHRTGNSVIITSDELAHWVREDFPDYQIEASVIKNIDTHVEIEGAFDLYDTVVLPMRMNQDTEFLSAIARKERITLFANAGCALTCPSKICYPSISRANKFTGEKARCSFELKPREMLGIVDFDLDQLVRLGFSRFKMLRPREHGVTGY